MGLLSWFKRLSNDQALLELKETMEKYTVQVDPEVAKLQHQVEVIIGGTAISERTIFENLVRATYKDYKNTLYSYRVRCASLDVDKVLIRLACYDNTIAFMDEDEDKIYYMAPRETQRDARHDLMIFDRDFQTEQNFASLAEDYIGSLYCEDDMLLKIQQILENHGKA